MSYNVRRVGIADGYSSAAAPRPAGGGGKRFATLVVGSNEGVANGHYGEADVDYLCTGSGDQTTINTAINAAVTLGTEGVVLLLDGVYNLSGAVVLKDGVSLVGVSSYVTLSTTTATCISGTSLKTRGGAIRSLRLHANNDSARVLQLVDCAKWEVTGCTITAEPAGTGFNRYGAWFESCSDIRFENNHVHGCSVGVEFNGTDTGKAGLAVGNTVSDCFYGGIVVAVGGAAVAGNTIQGITSTSSFATGIYVSGADVAVTGNRVQGASVALSGATFSTAAGNTVRGGSIKVESSAASCSVTGNVVRDARLHGILVSSSHNNVISDNVVTGWGTAASSATYDGIHLVSADTNTVQGNRAHSRSAGGRFALNVSNSNCDNNLVTNNDLLNGGGLNNAGTGTITSAGNRV